MNGYALGLADTFVPVHVERTGSCSPSTSRRALSRGNETFGEMSPLAFEAMLRRGSRSEAIAGRATS